MLPGIDVQKGISLLQLQSLHYLSKLIKSLNRKVRKGRKVTSRKQEELLAFKYKRISRFLCALCVLERLKGAGGS
jgi:hypothetical protein